MEILHITKENFQTEVMESDKTVLLDFWAAWCGPCRMIAPVLEEVAQEQEDVKVCKIDVDKEPELAQQFQIMSIPTTDGKPAEADLYTSVTISITPFQKLVAKACGDQMR